MSTVYRVYRGTRGLNGNAEEVWITQAQVGDYPSIAAAQADYYLYIGIDSLYVESFEFNDDFEVPVYTSNNDLAGMEAPA